MSHNYRFENRQTGTFREEFGRSMGGFFAWLVKLIVMLVLFSLLGVGVIALMVQNTSKQVRKRAPAVKRELKKTADELVKPVEVQERKEKK